MHFHLIFMRYIIFFVYFETGVHAPSGLYIRPISFAIASFGIRTADESGRCPVPLDSAVAFSRDKRGRLRGHKNGNPRVWFLFFFFRRFFNFFFFIPFIHVRGPCHLRARRSVQDAVLVISPLCERYHACTQIGPIRSLQARVSLDADTTS